MNMTLTDKIKPAHRTWVEVNTDALRFNFEQIRKAVDPHAGICAVVKADAYGHGAGIVARALEGKADFFMVAEIHEAMILRDDGIKTPILIAGRTDPRYAELMASNGISQCVFSLGYAEALNAALNGKKLKIHVKLDTGMARLGFTVDREDFPEQMKKLFELKNLEPEGVFTHYAESDEPGSDFTGLQTQRFDRALKLLEEKGIGFRYRHAANSAAAFCGDNSKRELARVGICLYGAAPSESMKRLLPELRPVMALKTRVAQIRELRVGEGVGYGRHFFAARPTKIAVLCAGYADGLPRLLAASPGAHAIDADSRLVGSVCMDMCFVDVTDSGTPLAEGQEVTLFGANGISADEWAEFAQTINYEIFCRVTARVPRIEVRDRENG